MPVAAGSGWLLSWYFSTRGEEGNFHVHFMQGPPGCLAILHGAHVDAYTHNRKTRHEWTQDELEDLQLQLQATASAVTMTKKKSP